MTTPLKDVTDGLTVISSPKVQGRLYSQAMAFTGDTLPNTIRRMTGAIADRFMIPERGYLKEGYYADLTVLNEDEIKAATPDQEKSFGIEKVMINGRMVLSDGQLDREALKTTGRALPVL